MSAQNNTLTLPRPEEIRLQLSQSLKESARLRRLLRLSQQAAALERTAVAEEQEPAAATGGTR